MKVKDVAIGWPEKKNEEWINGNPYSVEEFDIGYNQALDEIGELEVKMSKTLTIDQINKIETLIGYVKAAGEGKYPFGDNLLIKIAEEAQEWIDGFNNGG